MVFLGLSFQREVTVIGTAYFWSIKEFSTASPRILVKALPETQYHAVHVESWTFIGVGNVPGPRNEKRQSVFWICTV